MGLKDYKSKREFGKTPEPKPALRRKGKRLVFVVQKHAARALHYDLRLEMEGVLKSWAVPKGVSLDPSIKRLAVMVEDHPLDYKDFEGVIPEGNYGAGSVIIWDRGFYRHPSDGNGKESERLLLEGLKKGDMKFVLEGEKLQGEFALVKTRKDEKSWLLLKKKDRYATTEDILTENRSVASDRTLEDLSATEPKTSSRTGKNGPDPSPGSDGRGRSQGCAGCADAAPHQTDARNLDQRTVRSSGLALRGEMGRVPGRRRSQRRKRLALFPKRALVQPEVFSHCRTRSGNSDSMPFWTAKSSSWTIGAMPISRCCRIT